MTFVSEDLFVNGLLIAFFAAVQSIFGMGVLVFGTPTFLLLGYGFTETLGILLPSSLSISIAQVALHKGRRPAISKALGALCLPAVGLSLFVTISANLTRYAYFLVAVALVMSAAARTVPQFKQALRGAIVRHLKLFHVVIGLFHGVTNLGGALLAVMAPTIHPDKDNARYVVAVYYMSFVLVQAAVLVITVGGGIFLPGVVYVPLTAVIYLILGNRLFRTLNNNAFQQGMTGFLVLYAAILVLRWAAIL